MNNIFSEFAKAIDNNMFFKLADKILAKEKNPEILAKCAEISKQREPGGTYYQYIFWNKTIFELENRHNGTTKLELNKICKNMGLNYQTALSYSKRGSLLSKTKLKDVERRSLKFVDPKVFQNEIKRGDMADKYLQHATKILTKNLSTSPTTIHFEWCKKYGSLKDNYDIIKPSDWWAFGQPKWIKDPHFDGSIPGEIYANALYYFAPKKGIAIDPMAGSGMLKRVFDDRKMWQKDSDFKLKIHLFDLYPAKSFIKKHNATKMLPIKADWIFIDPPYFNQSSHLFKCVLSQTQNYSEYISEMKKIITAMYQSLNKGGIFCVLLPKWSGNNQKENIDIPSDIKTLCIKEGFIWIDSAFISRGRQQEPASAQKNILEKKNRQPISDTCVLNVFSK